MPQFIVTFRLANDSSYQDRYESFIDKAKQMARLGPWGETTSFLAFESLAINATAESVCSDLYYGSKFDSTKDVMVVADLDSRTKATKGEIKYPTLLASSLGF